MHLFSSVVFAAACSLSVGIKLRQMLVDGAVPIDVALLRLVGEFEDTEVGESIETPKLCSSIFMKIYSN